MSEICDRVAVELIVQPFSGEAFSYAKLMSSLMVMLSLTSVHADSRIRVFFDVRICNLNTLSYYNLC